VLANVRSTGRAQLLGESRITQQVNYLLDKVLGARRKKASHTIGHLYGDATCTTGDDGVPSQGFGDDQSEALADRLLQDHLRASLEAFTSRLRSLVR
jgi:hypothetical protein